MQMWWHTEVSLFSLKCLHLVYNKILYKFP
jgi:hypothetical protein